MCTYLYVHINKYIYIYINIQVLGTNKLCYYSIIKWFYKQTLNVYLRINRDEHVINI